MSNWPYLFRRFLMNGGSKIPRLSLRDLFSFIIVS